MPSSRKRIGFLPNEEVQKIIDKISLKNNLSQSKVTGILVEEALNARNLYKTNKKVSFKNIDSMDNFYDQPCDSIDNSLSHKNNYAKEDKEYKLIKEYLNYKNFKKILSIVETES